MGQIAARDYELGLETFDKLSGGAADRGVVARIPRAEVDVRHVEDAGAHRRSRLQ